MLDSLTWKQAVAVAQMWLLGSARLKRSHSEALLSARTSVPCSSWHKASAPAAPALSFELRWGRQEAQGAMDGGRGCQQKSGGLLPFGCGWRIEVTTKAGGSSEMRILRSSPSAETMWSFSRCRREGCPCKATAAAKSEVLMEAALKRCLAAAAAADRSVPGRSWSSNRDTS